MFSKASCSQAWRWNLDYVTDSRGNAIAYFYSSETNYYAADNGTKATAGYTQAGVVSKIEYGLRAGSVYGVTPAGDLQRGVADLLGQVPADHDRDGRARRHHAGAFGLLDPGAGADEAGHQRDRRRDHGHL